MRYALSLVLVLACYLLSGCGSDVTRLTDQKHESKSKDYPIEIYYDQIPDRPFERIAILREASEWTTAGEKLIAALKKSARKIGADAILLKNVGSHTTQGGAVVSTIGTTAVVTPISGEVGTAEAVAICWTGPARSAVVGQTPAQPAPVAGLHTWQLTVNSNPVGALIQAYDSNQTLVQIGRAPAIITWPLQTQADTLVLFWQGRQIALLPTGQGQGVFVDFTKQPPEVSGATALAPGH